MNLLIWGIIGALIGISVYGKYKRREEDNQCIHCGAPYDENSVYCPDCGRNLAKERKRYKPISRNSNVQNKTTKFCPNCGNQIDMADSFCSECGNQL